MFDIDSILDEIENPGPVQKSFIPKIEQIEKAIENIEKPETVDLIDFNTSVDFEPSDEVQAVEPTLLECDSFTSQNLSKNHSTFPSAENISNPQPQSVLGILKPEWIEDSTTSECLRCNITFNFIKRRHHCRACGLIFCANCCSKFRLLSFLTKAERICLICDDEFTKLEQQTLQKNEKKPESILCLTPKSKKNRVKFEDGTAAIRPSYEGQVDLPKAPLIKRQRMKLLESNPENAITLCYPPVKIDENLPKEVALSISAENLASKEDHQITFTLTDNFTVNVSKNMDFWHIKTFGVAKFLGQKDFLVKLHAGNDSLPNRFVFNWLLQLWNFTKNQSVNIDSFCYQKFKQPGIDFGYSGCIWFPDDDQCLQAYLLDDYKLNWLRDKTETLGPRFFPHSLLHCLYKKDNFDIAHLPFTIKSQDTDQDIPTIIKPDRQNYCTTISQDSFIAFIHNSEWLLHINLLENSDFLSSKINSSVAIPLVFYFSKTQEFIHLTPWEEEDSISLKFLYFGPLKIGYQLNINPHFYPMIYDQISKSKPCSLEGFDFSILGKSEETYNAIKFTENSLKKRKGKKIEIKYFNKNNGQRPGDDDLQELTQLVKLQIEEFYENIELPMVVEVLNGELVEHSLIGTIFNLHIFKLF